MANEFGDRLEREPLPDDFVDTEIQDEKELKRESEREDAER